MPALLPLPALCPAAHSLVARCCAGARLGRRCTQAHAPLALDSTSKQQEYPASLIHKAAAAARRDAAASVKEEEEAQPLLLPAPPAEGGQGAGGAEAPAPTRKRGRPRKDEARL